MLRLGRVELSGGFLLSAALLFYLDTKNLLSWAALAAGLHELGHFAAVRALGGRVARLRLTVTGGDMELDGRRSLTYGGELCAILTGPAANLLLALLAARLGERWESGYLLAGLSLSLGWFNLLPVRPLDGGRALQLILSGLLGESAAIRAVRYSSLACASALLALGGTLLRRGGGPSLLVMGVWLLACGLKEESW